ncbi:MAG: glycosyltransferase [Lactobacillales bacterium]|nr:glycosyltransferase [Lactobacillales bacterium]
MKKYKICVYAISKNEEKFVDRFMDSLKEIDKVYVLDTGSTDDTVNKLKNRGAIVEQKIIDPWRFDVARNLSLDMVPEDIDICICLDLDEVIEEGFIETINNLWKDDTTRLRYNYNWKLDNDNKPLVNFYIEKIHSRKNYKWTHPVHEVLTYLGDKENFITTDLITVNHYPDDTKSRSSYLPLLELSIKEDPTDDRNMHYLGREYMYYHKWNECIDTLIKHLSLKTATWKDERCASMRFIARSYKKLKRYEEANMWLLKAIDEAPYLRDPYVEMALLQYEIGNYDKVIHFCNLALEIKTHTKSYINEQFSFDSTIYDLLSISYYYLNDLESAIKNVDKALEFDKENIRLINNKKFFEKEL